MIKQENHDVYSCMKDMTLYSISGLALVCTIKSHIADLTAKVDETEGVTRISNGL